MAMTMLFICWLIWVMGWVKFLFRVRKDTRAPRVRPFNPLMANAAPTTAQST